MLMHVLWENLEDNNITYHQFVWWTVNEWPNVVDVVKLVEITNYRIGRVFGIWKDGAGRVLDFSQNIYPCVHMMAGIVNKCKFQVQNFKRANTNTI